MATTKSLLEFSGQPVKTIEDVPIYSKANARIKIGSTEKTVPLFLTGAGIRTKKILLLRVKGYVAASYIDSVKPLDPQNPLASLEAAKVKAIQLTLLRDLSSERIRGAFADSLRANEVDLNSLAVKKTLDSLTFDLTKGSTVTLLGYAVDPKSDQMTWELPGSNFTIQGEKVASLFWKMWFGVPSDGGLEDLRTDLIGKP